MNPSTTQHGQADAADGDRPGEPAGRLGAGRLRHASTTTPTTSTMPTIISR